MKNFLFATFIALTIISCKEKAKESMKEKAVEVMPEVIKEASNEAWVSLFDGTSFNGWHEYLQDGVSDHWKIEDGAMVFYPPEKREKGVSYNLVSDNEYTDFELSIDWRISEAGNSGIFWGIKELPNVDQPYKTGPEIQVLDNDKHPDGKNGTSHQAGALYDMVSPTKDVTKPVGEWNTCVITVNNTTHMGSVQLNGEKIVEFPLNNEEWNAMVAKSKFANWEHFGKYTTGKIGLQDHGNVVAFRNIKIRKL